MNNNLSNSEIQFIQSILKKLGYYDGLIDAIIGEKTQNAIRLFQEQENLPVTVELDSETMNVLNKYLLGFETYSIKEGDTLYSIANNNNSSVQSIITANPDINPFLLQEGLEINIPYNYNIIPTDISYSYDILKINIEGLKKRYPFIITDSIGTSVDNRKIYRIRIGNGARKVSYNASHHANEWITSSLLMSWLERFLDIYSLEGSIKGFSTEEIWNRATIDLVPMVNPDGVELVTNGLDNITVNRDEILAWNNYNEDFSKWKANINGVDLNRNYDADFEEYKSLEAEFGVTGPASALYAGPEPGSEPESRALIQLTQSNDYRLVLAYHTQGQVIFWNYRDLQPEEYYNIALAFNEVSGYALARPELSQSYAGYKDWFIKAFRRPGYTIEVGKGVNPLPIDQFPMIYENNEEFLLLASII